MQNLNDPAIRSVFDNPEFVRWFFGQCVAFVGVTIALGLWIWTLLRDVTNLRNRNDKLSDTLVQNTENGMRERLQMATDHLLQHDSTVRNIIVSLSDALSKRRRDLER